VRSLALPVRLTGRSGVSGALQGIGQSVAAQRPQLALWLPVFLGIGIGIHLLLPEEPDIGLVWASGLGGAAMVLPLLAGRWPLAALAGMVLAGFALSGVRTHQVAAPVLERPYWGAVEGRVAGLSRSEADAPRVLLDQVYLPGIAPDRTPALVRVSLLGLVPEGVLDPGARITVQARLSPPAPPAEPGAFDFRRAAWFDRLGGVGYSRDPVLRAGPPGPPDLHVRVFAARMAIADYLRAAIPGPSGAFAAAIVTNDRSGIDPVLNEALRASNLSHLLSISGLHMGLLTGFVFVFVRSGLALVPALALRLPTKKIAAAVAMAMGAGYLVLAGFDVPTERSFVMAAVMLGAVMLDRPAISMRSVAYAALIVLVRRPESLADAGFQMSFAATAALVGVFHDLKASPVWQALQQDRFRLLRAPVMLCTTSLVAGSATAPYAAFHFNRMANWGLVANLLAVPLMGVVVMPAGVVAGLLWPFGLDGIPLWVMGKGIDAILWVAHAVASFPGSVGMVKAGGPAVLPLMTLGGLLMLLWRGASGRLAGLALAGLALVLWAGTPRPGLLVSGDGRLVGILGPDGRALNVGKGHGFEAESWLENDGDTAGQEIAASRPVAERRRGYLRGSLPDGTTVVWRGRDAVSQFDCRPGTVLVAPAVRRPPGGGCLFLGEGELARMGAVSVTSGPGGLVLRSAIRSDRMRPWDDPAGYARQRDQK
jgi:competence protein ComEC